MTNLQAIMVANRIKEVLPSVMERNQFYLSEAWPMVRNAVNDGDWFLLDKTGSGFVVEVFRVKVL